MGWGTIELEKEVEDWLLELTDDAFGQVERYIDLLAQRGVHLGEPFSASTAREAQGTALLRRT